MLKKRFAYAADLLCLACWALYAVNRFLLSGARDRGPLRGHVSDLLFVPAVLPLVLWVQRKLGWRALDTPRST